MDNFESELRNLINKHSRENGSNTPNFLLAEYLNDCLKAFDSAVRGRDRWYGVAAQEVIGAEVPNSPIAD